MIRDARCVLDPKITVETLPFFEEDIRMAWGALCSRNRGVFVTDPPDGHTYGCANLPEAWGPKNVNEVRQQAFYVDDSIRYCVYLMHDLGCKRFCRY
jgi:hypothetical protein